MAQQAYLVIGVGGTPTAFRPLAGGADIPLTAPANTRDSLTYGNYMPDATTTGPVPGVALTPMTGVYTITAGGTVANPKVYGNFDLVGQLVIRAANVVIQNFRVRYDDTNYTSNTALVNTTDPACANVQLVDFETNGKSATGHASLWLDGVLGQGVIARRGNMHHTVDGAGWSTNDVSYRGCWVHDLAGFLVDPNHSNGPTHNDGFQIQGGNNQDIVGNNLNCTIATDVADGATWAANGGTGGQWAGSCIQTNRATSNITTGWVIERNWFDNAKLLVNLSGNGAWASANPSAPYPVFDSVSYNRFGHNSAPGSGGYNDNYTILYASTTTLTQAVGNVYDDNGVAVHLRNNAAA